MYIFNCRYLMLYNIGSRGQFPLPLYCALPIATIDLINCIYGHVHSSLRILVNISGPIEKNGVVDFVTLWNYLNPWLLG